MSFSLTSAFHKCRELCDYDRKRFDSVGEAINGKLYDWYHEEKFWGCAIASPLDLTKKLGDWKRQQDKKRKVIYCSLALLGLGGGYGELAKNDRISSAGATIATGGREGPLICKYDGKEVVIDVIPQSGTNKEVLEMLAKQGVCSGREYWYPLR
jgi:hypothetical protein